MRKRVSFLKCKCTDNFNFYFKRLVATSFRNCQAMRRQCVTCLAHASKLYMHTLLRSQIALWIILKVANPRDNSRYKFLKGIENRNLAVPFFLLTETHNFYESRDGNLQVSDVGQGLTFRCGRFQPHSCGNGRRKLESRLCCEGSPLLIPYPRYRRVAHDNGAACFHERAFNFACRPVSREAFSLKAISTRRIERGLNYPFVNEPRLLPLFASSVSVNSSRVQK